MVNNFDIENFKKEFEAEFDKRAAVIRESHDKFHNENRDYLKLRLGDFAERADDIKEEAKKLQPSKNHEQFTKEYDSILKKCTDLKVQLDSVKIAENLNSKEFRDSIRGSIEEAEQILKNLIQAEKPWSP